jgi:hypothetical protein
VIQSTEPSAPFKRNWIGLAFVALLSAYMLFSVIYGVLYPSSPMTPAQVQEQVSIQAANSAAIRATIEANKYARNLGTALCHQKTICAKLPNIRQECATAGNFDNCIKVKIGDEDYSSVTYCTNEGNLAYTPENMPDVIDCWFRNHGMR